ncbi:MAG: BatD family protein [bacterium]|nr:BatD family protein [bacterium]
MGIIRWLFMLVWMSIQTAQGFDGTTDFFIEASLNNTAPYVGEQITYTMRYYAISQEGITPQFPDFEGFWIGESYDAFNGIQVINQRQFFVREIQIHIAPLESGDLSIGEASLIVAGDVFRSEQIIMTPILPLSVRPLPDGAPPSFLGAVGDFTMSADFEVTSLTLGNPFLFTIRLQGTGILERLNPPMLNLPADWRILPQSPQYTQGTIGVLFGEKLFQWVIIPNEAGTHTIPAIEWSYFDPRAQAYVTLSTPSFPLTILPSPDGEIRLSPLSSALLTNTLPLKSSDLNYYFYDFLDWRWWQLCWGVMPVIFILTAMVSMQQRRQAHSHANKRYKTALARAKKRLKGLNTTPNSSKMTLVIMAYIADKCNVTTREANDHFSRYVKNPDVLASIEALLATIKSMTYTPQDTGYDIPVLLDDIENGLVQLDIIWEKTR